MDETVRRRMRAFPQTWARWPMLAMVAGIVGSAVPCSAGPDWASLEDALTRARTSSTPVVVVWPGEAGASHWLIAEIEGSLPARVANALSFVKLDRDDLARPAPMAVDELRRYHEAELARGRTVVGGAPKTRDWLRIVTASPAVVILGPDLRVVRRFDTPDPPRRGIRAARELEEITRRIRSETEQRRTIDALIADIEEKIRRGNTRAAVEALIPWEEPRRLLSLEPALALRIADLGSRLRERAMGEIESVLAKVVDARAKLVSGPRGPADRSVDTLQKAIRSLETIGREYPFPDIAERVGREIRSIAAFLDLFGLDPPGVPGAPGALPPGLPPR